VPSRAYETVEGPSVRPSVCLSVRLCHLSTAARRSLSRHSSAAAACSEFAAECRAVRAADIDRQRRMPSSSGASARHSAANANSFTFTADVGNWTQTCFMAVLSTQSHCYQATQSRISAVAVSAKKYSAIISRQLRQMSTEFQNSFTFLPGSDLIGKR